MIKAVIFDMDGVIFDTIPFAREEFLKIYPSITEEMYNELHTGNYFAETAKYAHLKIPETEEAKHKRLAEYAEAKTRSKMFDGIREVLEDLKAAGLLLILNTNAFEKNVLPLLAYSGIEELFSFVAAAELSKSKVEKFKLIKERFDLMNEDTLFITDALGDVREADEAGIPTVAVTWGVHDTSYFEREAHDNLKGIVHSPEELAHFIQQAR